MSGNVFFFISNSIRQRNNNWNLEAHCLLRFCTNLVKICVVKFHQASKLKPVQKHCFWWPVAPMTFPQLILDTLGETRFNLFFRRHIFHDLGLLKSSEHLKMRPTTSNDSRNDLLSMCIDLNACTPMHIDVRHWNFWVWYICVGTQNIHLDSKFPSIGRCLSLFHFKQQQRKKHIF